MKTDLESLKRLLTMYRSKNPVDNGVALQAVLSGNSLDRLLSLAIRQGEALEKLGLVPCIWSKDHGQDPRFTCLDARPSDPVSWCYSCIARRAQEASHE